MAPIFRDSYSYFPTFHATLQLSMLIYTVLDLELLEATLIYTCEDFHSHS